MGFLGDLAGAINNQLNSANQSQLGQLVNGGTTPYGSLGDLTTSVDQSSERRYLEDGFLRTDPFSIEPKQFQVLFQEPNATILIKKSVFSSINENYRPDYMDIDEKLYFKTMKVLFQNKCQQIQVLESLSKIQQITQSVGNINDQLMPIIITLGDAFTANGSSFGNTLFGQVNTSGDISSFSSALEKIRRLSAYNSTNQLTTWITDSTNWLQSQFGQGTGVIEVTNFTSFNTNVSVNSIATPGTFSFTIADPYQSMLITEWDIEKAISDATNPFYNSPTFQLSLQAGQTAINGFQTTLNQIRNARGASTISINVNPNTLINTNQVVALLGNGTQIQFTYDSGFLGLGASTSVAPEYLEGGAIAGLDGLSSSPSTAGIGPDQNIQPLFPQNELSVFGSLISAIYNQLQLEASSQSSQASIVKGTNYVRRKMRFQFLGRLIVQPMDVVHMYVNSSSQYDTRLLDGLQGVFSGQGILQNLNSTITSVASGLSNLLNPSGSIQFQAEKSAFVGASFPNYLWASLRSQFVTENQGTHIFAGVVESAPQGWADGKFTVTVSGKDNTVYFDMGKVNWKPGVDNFNGPLMDPLTPFVTNFDTVSSNSTSQSPQLLNENMFLLGSSTDTDPPLIKFKLGHYVGLPARQDNINQDQNINPTINGASKIYYAPDGLVYKWKEGIGTLTQYGSSVDMNDSSLVGSPAITKEPFAGQDVMNVISLLVTGIPYNYANYWKTVANFDGFSGDPMSGQNAAYSYYTSLQNSLQKNNITWGNFVPYKNLTMDDQSNAAAMQGQLRATNRNNQLDNLVQQLVQVTNQVNMFAAGQVLPGTATQQSQFQTDSVSAQARQTALKNQINSLISLQQKQDMSSYGNTLSSTGDPSFDSGGISSGSSPGDSLSDLSLRQLLRRELNFLTRRMSYNVRANSDKNLFIVDDYYDKDYDVLAYETSLADGVPQYNNEFTSVREKIKMTADLLNLEVFADTQGHIRVRPPQYNRMPSSVFYRMMYLSKIYGIQIYPQFLGSLFQTQIQTLTTNLEVVENQIRLDCAVLGYNTDSACITFMQQYGTSNNSGGGPFTFVSDSTSFRVADLSSLIMIANPDNSTGTVPIIPPIATTANASNIVSSQAAGLNFSFNSTSKYTVVVQALTNTNGQLTQAGYGIQNIPSYAANTRIDALIQILQTDTGQQIPRNYYLVTNNLIGNGVNIPVGQSIDVIKVVSDLTDKINTRQQVIRSLNNAISNANEAASLSTNNSITNSLSSALSTPGLFGNPNIPEVFEHMIEDETYDDYGTGSGTRYVIKRPQIRKVEITESPPDYTLVQVNGQINPILPQTGLPNSFGSGGGNGLVTAMAIDYDTWRRYGFRQSTPVNVPFLSDPDTQCAPYAAMILSRARKNILRGTITISGNEFMQPGEVIFLQDWQMLFYVNAVRHSFTYGSGFTTTLDVNYGHAAGDYIPTTADVIGKLIYSNRNLSNITIQRQDSSSNEINLGIVVLDPTSSTGSNVLNLGNPTDSIGAYTATNAATLTNVLYQASNMINNNSSSGNNIQASVELRIYYDSINNPSGGLGIFAASVLNYLTTPQSGPVQSPISQTSSPPNPVLSSSSVSIVAVQLDDMTVFSSPSQKAIATALNLVNTNSISGGGASQPTNSSDGGTPVNNNSSSVQKAAVRTNLYSYVVDCWLVFAPTPDVNTTSGGS